tara:strand:+ start:890 stop:1072 length:183 start_codon:yes stop_codon:yes gene_type:complete
MVAFARAKAKSLFSQIRFTAFKKRSTVTEDKRHDEELFNKKEKTSNQFFEAIKSGGIWLS